MSTSNSSSAFPSSHHTSSLIKLTRNNHPLWKAQIVLTLQAHDLFGHVDGSLECPAKVLPDSTTSIMKANLAYASWYQKDKVVLSTPSKLARSPTIIILPILSNNISADSTSAMSEPVVNSNQDIPFPPPSARAWV
jgi:hypothetical protein